MLFVKTNINIKETTSAATAFPASFEMISGLFFFIGAADGEQIDKSGQDSINDENDGQIGVGFKPFIQKIADNEPDQNGTGKHQSDGGISAPFFLVWQRRHGFQYSRQGGKDFAPFSPAALRSPRKGG
jgi:hypothetical protein